MFFRKSKKVTSSVTSLQNLAADKMWIKLISEGTSENPLEWLSEWSEISLNWLKQETGVDKSTKILKLMRIDDRFKTDKKVERIDKLLQISHESRSFESQDVESYMRLLAAETKEISAYRDLVNKRRGLRAKYVRNLDNNQKKIIEAMYDEEVNVASKDVRRARNIVETKYFRTKNPEYDKMFLRIENFDKSKINIYIQERMALSLKLLHIIA